jgi:nitric oxide reductase NorE protein
MDAAGSNVGLELPEAARASPSSRIPGDVNVWVFVIGDMVIFSAYFAAYLFLERGQTHQSFLHSQAQLSQTLGLVNTLILLTSSLCIALTVAAARDGKLAVASRFLALGGGLGVVFLLVKSYEWADKIGHGLSIVLDTFFMHYYILTGLHVMHVIVGFVFLIVLGRELRSDGGPRMQLVEVCATYWHMVDFLWILIFALLYLMR